MTGLRERKRERTRTAISEAAIALFVEHGFEQVSITQVAEAAEVSRRTLFAYFPTKEDLVVHRFADHESEPARIVRARPPDTTPLQALRDHFLDGLRRRDPITGLNDLPVITDLLRMLFASPALKLRMSTFRTSSEEMLARAIQGEGPPELPARVTAAQLAAVQWLLSQDNFRLMVDGVPAEDRYPQAVADAELAFGMLG
ncbi:MAG: TetR family transcriptional regulator [Nonomuraea sp.]|nr:TetR family transcriptional regulator [Nonomuraea sp.]